MPPRGWCGDSMDIGVRRVLKYSTSSSQMSLQRAGSQRAMWHTLKLWDGLLLCL